MFFRLLPYGIFLQDLRGLSVQKYKELSTRTVIGYQTNMCFGLQGI